MIEKKLDTGFVETDNSLDRQTDTQTDRQTDRQTLLL